MDEKIVKESQPTPVALTTDPSPTQKPEPLPSYYDLYQVEFEDDSDLDILSQISTHTNPDYPPADDIADERAPDAGAVCVLRVIQPPPLEACNIAQHRERLREAALEARQREPLGPVPDYMAQLAEAVANSGTPDRRLDRTSQPRLISYEWSRDMDMDLVAHGFMYTLNRLSLRVGHNLEQIRVKSEFLKHIHDSRFLLNRLKFLAHESKVEYLEELAGVSEANDEQKNANIRIGVARLRAACLDVDDIRRWGLEQHCKIVTNVAKEHVYNRLARGEQPPRLPVPLLPGAVAAAAVTVARDKQTGPRLAAANRTNGDKTPTHPLEARQQRLKQEMLTRSSRPDQVSDDKI